MLFSILYAAVFLCSSLVGDPHCLSCSLIIITNELCTVCSHCCINGTMPSTICAINECPNSQKKLRQWRKGWCSKHEIIFGIGCCTCPPPFALFPLPKNGSTCNEWTRAVNELEIVYDQSGHRRKVPWKPSVKYSRLCSDHCVDSHPTSLHQTPTLKLGYITRQVVVRRKLN